MGCAGGGDSLITLPVEQDAVDSASYDSYRQEKHDVHNFSGLLLDCFLQQHWR